MIRSLPFPLRARVLALVVAGSMVAACGGDDDDDSGSSGPIEPTAEITEANAEAITENVVAAAFIVAEFEELIELLIEIGGPEIGEPLAGPAEDISDELCEGGTADLTLDLDDPGTLSPGDTISLTFVACNSEFGELDGGLTLVVNSFTGNLDLFLFRVSGTLTMAEFSLTEDEETVTLDGVVTVSLDTSDFPNFNTVVSGNRLEATQGESSLTIRDFSNAQNENLILDVYSVEAEGAVDSSAFEGTVTYSTETPFAGEGDDDPDVGVLVILGANDASITVTVLIESVYDLQVDIDFDGDGEPDATVFVDFDDFGNFGNI